MNRQELHSFIRETAPEYGLDPEISLRQAEELERLTVVEIAELQRCFLFICDPDNTRQNVRGGMTLLQSLLAHYAGDKRKAYAAWHWGVEDVDTAVKAYNVCWEGHVPSETIVYLHRVLGPDNVVIVPHRPGAIAQHGTEVIPDKKAA